MKHTGIWLDKNKALIVTIENGAESMKTIPSNFEHFNPQWRFWNAIKRWSTRCYSRQ